MRFFLLAFGLLALGAGVAPADNCRQRVVQHQAVVEVQAVTAAVFTPLVVQVPTYSIGYAPEALFGRGQPGQQPSQPDPTVAQILQELQGFRADIAALKGQPLAPLPPVPAPPPAKSTPPVPVPPPAPLQPVPPLPAKVQAPAPGHVQLFNAKCAACHEAAVAAKKGGQFVLLSGQVLAPLTDSQKLRVAAETYSGRMPRGGKITDEEVGTIMSWLGGK